MPTNQFVHRGRAIVANTAGTKSSLEIDGKEIPVEYANGKHYSPMMPYKAYDDLQSLAQQLIDVHPDFYQARQ